MGEKREGRKDTGSHISFSLSGKTGEHTAAEVSIGTGAAENVGFEGRCTCV